MRARAIKAKRRNETLFVFEFENQMEFDFWMEALEWFAPLEKKHFESESLAYLADTLKSRTDSKYATEEFKLSGLLFEHEMADFAGGAIACAVAAELELLSIKKAAEKAEVNMLGIKNTALTLINQNYDAVHELADLLDAIPDPAAYEAVRRTAAYIYSYACEAHDCLEPGSEEKKKEDSKGSETADSAETEDTAENAEES